MELSNAKTTWAVEIPYTPYDVSVFDVYVVYVSDKYEGSLNGTDDTIFWPYTEEGEPVGKFPKGLKSNYKFENRSKTFSA